MTFCKSIFLICIISIGVLAQAQNNQSETKINVVDLTENVTEINILTADVKFNNVNSLNECVVTFKDGTPILEEGSPDLEKLTISLIIPDYANMEVVVEEAEYVEYNNINIAPSKGNLFRNTDPASVPYFKNSTYSQDDFFPGKLCELRNPYILRDFRGQTVIIYPLQYNPVMKTLRVYKKLKIKVINTGNDSFINSYDRRTEDNFIDDEFINIYRNQFANFDYKYTPLQENHGNILIICYDAFINSMMPYVEWKTMIGFPTEIVAVSTIGSSSAQIKQYVANYYNTNGLTYLLLVGDAAQIPTCENYWGEATDNTYGYILGNDSYPEIFIGRFSAENIEDVETQVERTITYEKNPPVTGSWCGKGIGLGSAEGPGDDDEMDYEHIRNIRTKLLDYTYLFCEEFYDGNQGGDDSNGDPSPEDITTAVNEGIGIINYCGHGWEGGFVTSNFTINEINNNLTNVNKLPFIFSVACVNGEFVSGTCFAETWLRAKDNSGNPTGAIATLMSTVYQSWNPPMCGQDEMTDILTESYLTNIKRTFGGIAMNGCMKMNDEYGSDGDDMTDTWTIFGDPSIMIRTADPQTMSVTHPSVISFSASQLTVNCDVEDAFVTLTCNQEIIGTAVVDNGIAVFAPLFIDSCDTITIAVTAYNYIPYIGKIFVSYSNIPEYDNLSHGKINIHPSPAIDKVNISFDLPFERNIRLKVYNSAGMVSLNLIENVVYKSGEHRIECNINELNAGLYFVVLYVGNEVWQSPVSVIR